MQNIIYIRHLFLSFLGLVIFGCVEPIDIEESINFEKSIVIEATITNELKHHEIMISNAFRFENDLPTAESNAKVTVTDNDQKTYLFQEQSPGTYVSIEKFSAQPNKSYQLSIVTSQGKTYASQKVQIPDVSQIDQVVASKERDQLGNEVVSILVDSYDPDANSKYYRFEYEETYKIIAPYWTNFDLVAVENGRPNQLEFRPKTKEERVCYNTVYSNSIIQTETSDLSEDRVHHFEVRRLSLNDPIIAHRYSILVKQYVQNLEAYSYYKTLNKISSSDNIFSSNQPGFINGNVYSVEDPNELVIGYFDLTSVSSKRMFFNYTDFFPDAPLPPYFIDCEFFAPSAISFEGEPSDLYLLINSGNAKYYSRNPDYPDPLNLNAGPYLLVDQACGDCTELGSNIVPDFWEE